MSKVNFYYIKSNQHQEIQVDGAIGGPSPLADRIYVSVYTERVTIPQLVVHELTEDGVLGSEIIDEREGKVGVTRIVQATLHMNLEQSKALHKWLGEQIVVVENMPKAKK